MVGEERGEGGKKEAVNEGEELLTTGRSLPNRPATAQQILLFLRVWPLVGGLALARGFAAEGCLVEGVIERLVSVEEVVSRGWGIFQAMRSGHKESGMGRREGARGIAPLGRATVAAVALVNTAGESGRWSLEGSKERDSVRISLSMFSIGLERECGGCSEVCFGKRRFWALGPELKAPGVCEYHGKNDTVTRLKRRLSGHACKKGATRFEGNSKIFPGETGTTRLVGGLPDILPRNPKHWFNWHPGPTIHAQLEFVAWNCLPNVYLLS